MMKDICDMIINASSIFDYRPSLDIDLKNTDQKTARLTIIAAHSLMPMHLRYFFL